MSPPDRLSFYSGGRRLTIVETDDGVELVSPHRSIDINVAELEWLLDVSGPAMLGRRRARPAVPRPRPPHEIPTPPTSVGIEEGKGGARG